MTVAEATVLERNPSVPFFIVWWHTQPMLCTQDRTAAQAAAYRYARGGNRRYVRIERVRPDWPATDRCPRTDAHAAHTWGGEGWSPFRCAGR